MNDDDLEQRVGTYGSRWRDAHPFSNDVDTSQLTRSSRGKTIAAIVAAAVVVTVAVGVAAALRRNGSSTVNPIASSSTVVTTTSTTTTTPSQLPPSIPSPQPPAGQIQVRANQPSEPLAVDNGRVWVGTPTGIDALDLVTMHQAGHVPIALPVLEIASSSDGVWVLSGRDESLKAGGNPPYRLERIDPATLHVAFSTDLPYVVGYRANEHVRLVAVPGTAWVALGQTVLRIDARTDIVTPIGLAGHNEANIAADDSGLWVETDGTDEPNVQDVSLVHVDAATNAVTTIPGLPIGFYWSIATTPNAVWMLAATDASGSLTLIRIDPATHAIRKHRVPGISLVAGDGQLWTQVAFGNAMNYGDLVGQIDTATGRISRTLKIAIGQVNGSSGNGYASPPFAIANSSIWSAYNGVQRTTLRG